MRGGGGGKRGNERIWADAEGAAQANGMHRPGGTRSKEAAPVCIAAVLTRPTCCSPSQLRLLQVQDRPDVPALEGWREEPKVQLLNLAYDLTPAGGEEHHIRCTCARAAAVHACARWPTSCCYHRLPPQDVRRLQPHPTHPSHTQSPPPCPPLSPADVVSVVVTEMGAVPPSSVAVILREAQRDASSAGP